MYKIEKEDQTIWVSGYVGMEDQDALLEFKMALMDQIETITEQMVIDLTMIEHFDGAGLQILLAARQTLQNLDKTLLLEIGDELTDLLALTGLDWIFQTLKVAHPEAGE